MTSPSDSIPLWILLILFWLILRLVITVTTPVFVLIHELGHAIPALLLGKKEPCIEIGAGKPLGNYAIGSIRLTIGSECLDQGRTSYDGQPQTKLQAIAIIGIAPAISLALSIAAVILWAQTSLTLPMHLILAGASLANTSIALRALNPWKGKVGCAASNPDNYESTSNDLQDLLRHFKGSDSS